MTCRFLTVLLIAVFAFAQTASAAAERAQVDQILDLSGVLGALETFPAQIEQQYKQRQIAATDPELEAAMTRIMTNAFRLDRARKVMAETVAQNLSTDQVTKMLTWYRSPLGKRFTAAEAEAQGPDGQANMRRYAADLGKNPPPRDRVEAIQRLEESAKNSEALVTVMEAVIRGVASTLQAARPDAPGTSPAEVDKALADMRPMLKQMTWQQVLVMSHYTYRDFRVADIQAYTAQIATPAGQAYYSAVFAGFAAVMGDLFSRMMPDIEKLRESKKT